MKIEINLEDILNEIDDNDDILTELVEIVWKHLTLKALKQAFDKKDSDIKDDFISLLVWNHLNAQEILNKAMDILEEEGYDNFFTFAHDLYWGYIKALKKKDIFNSLDQATLDYCGLQKDVKVHIRRE